MATSSAVAAADQATAAQYNNLRTDMLARASVSSGSYVGDDTENKAIAHGLGAAPKVVFITTAASTIVFIIIVGTGNITCLNAMNAYAVTVMDATNFYVGDIADYPTSANSNGITYYWVAIGIGT